MKPMSARTLFNYRISWSSCRLHELTKEAATTTPTSGEFPLEMATVKTARRVLAIVFGDLPKNKVNRRTEDEWCSPVETRYKILGSIDLPDTGHSIKNLEFGFVFTPFYFCQENRKRSLIGFYGALQRRPRSICF